jgi:Domain of unknown function (DUF4115)
MPETRVERIILGVGALAVAALAAVIALQVTDRFDTRQTQAATRPVTTASATTDTLGQAGTTMSASETPSGATAVSGPAETADGVRLRLSANADTWIEIRSGSAGGDVLYSGILPQGSERRFRGTQLWASFGAASNLAARLNGKPLPLPPGTYIASVSVRGLEPIDG